MHEELNGRGYSIVVENECILRLKTMLQKILLLTHFKNTSFGTFCRHSDVHYKHFSNTIAHSQFFIVQTLLKFGYARRLFVAHSFEQDKIVHACSV